MQLYIYFLGTGGSWPSSERNVSAIAVKRGREVLMFDCGEGTQRQIQKSPLSYMQITKIFITHFHGDHFLGLPGLIQTLQLNDRKEELHVYGPPGMKKLLYQLLRLGYFAPAYSIIGHDIKGGEELHFDGYDIKCIYASHNAPALSYSLAEDTRPGRFNKKRALELGVPEGRMFGKIQRGNVVEVIGKVITPDMILGDSRPGRKITISGDTKPYDDFIEFARDSDVLIHDATADSSLEEKANEYGHSTARQAAEIALKAGVGRLYLTHVSPRYRDAKPLEKEARDVFPESYVANDFMEVEVKLKK